MSDLMSVRLHLKGVRVLKVPVDAVDRLEVEVESTREWSRCPHCGFRCIKVWDRRAKRPPYHPGVASLPVLVRQL